MTENITRNFTSSTYHRTIYLYPDEKYHLSLTKRYINVCINQFKALGWDHSLSRIKISTIYILDWKVARGDISDEFTGRKSEFKLHIRGLVYLRNRPNNVSAIRNEA